MTIPFTDHVVHHQKLRKRLDGTNAFKSTDEMTDINEIIG